MRPMPKPTVVRDQAWLAYLRTLPCFFHPDGSCRDWTTIGKGPSEVSHLDGKSRDDRCLPMSGACHRTGAVSWHRGQETFCQHFDVTKDELIAAAEHLYAEFAG